ncbi:hypothetical protein [Neorhizobium sp. T25_13]|uniref:hypothetical protein n=1 Tax=Neorhizobium sp. T25_13 TaxID=2093830 RepID=UPI000CF84D68|nr:hypothetical protein [Neorhizobium sp. T25_13]
MGRRTIPFTEDSVCRAIRAVKKVGIEIKTIRIEPNGAVVMNGNGELSESDFVESATGYL